MYNKNKGIAYILVAAFFFSLMGLFVRLSGDIPSMQKSFFRNIVAFTIAFITILKKKQKITMNKEDIKYLFLRSVFGTMGIICNFYAIDHLVLSDASMLNKLSPFFAIIFSYIILKEKCSFVQVIAVAGAFVGAMFIIKPTGNVNNYPALVAMLGGMCAGIAYTMVRVLGKRGVKGEIIITVFSAFSCLVSLPFIIFDFTPMNLKQTIFLILAGISAAGGQFGITKAYFYAPAKEISVYDYSQIIFSALLGLVFLHQKADVYSFIGYVIICSMVLWMFFKRSDEQKKA